MGGRKGERERERGGLMFRGVSRFTRGTCSRTESLPLWTRRFDWKYPDFEMETNTESSDSDSVKEFNETPLRSLA